MVERFELRPWKPTPAACSFHVSRDFRSLRGRQFLVRGQLLLHLAAFWRVESLLDFFAWSERCAHLVCASNQERRGGKQGVNERLPDWSDDVHLASIITPGAGFTRSPRRREREAPGGARAERGRPRR